MPGRFRVALIVLLMVLGVSFATRVGLAIFNGDTSMLVPWRLAPLLIVGAIYDAAVSLWFILPFALLVWVWPARRASRTFGVVALATVAGLCAATEFTGVSEFVFCIREREQCSASVIA